MQGKGFEHQLTRKKNEFTGVKISRWVYALEVRSPTENNKEISCYENGLYLPYLF